MPPGSSSNEVDAQQPGTAARRGSKGDDLSADDWNFLLRFQDPQLPTQWYHFTAAAASPAGKGEALPLPQPSPGVGGPEETGISPAGPVQLEQRQASLREFQDQVQRWDLCRQQQAQAHAERPGGQLQQADGSGEAAAAAITPTGRALARHQSSASAPRSTVRPGRAAPPPLLSLPLGACREQLQASPCWAASPLLALDLAGLPAQWLAAAQGTPGCHAARWTPAGAAAALSSPQQGFDFGARQPGSDSAAAAQQRRPGSAMQQGSPDGRATGSPRQQQGPRRTTAAPRQWPGKEVPKQARGRAAKRGAAAVWQGEAVQPAQEQGGKGKSEEGAAAAGSRGRLRVPTKRKLEAAAEEEEEDEGGGGSGADGEAAAGAAAPRSPPKAARAAAQARGGASPGSAGGGAQKRQPGAAASSRFRGVSRHRLTQRWEASLWLAGKQMYLGGFVAEEDAARAYDLAALACKGLSVPTNFAASQYRESLAEVSGSSREEIVAWVRRRSSAFSRGRSRFRGVSGQAGHWEARIGTFGDRKNVSFGIHETEEEAAHQYDRALIVEKGRAAKTNYPISTYDAEVSAFEAFAAERCGWSHRQETAAFLARMALPFDPSSPDGSKATQPPVREKSKGGRPRNNAASVIFAAALQQALRTKK